MRADSRHQLRLFVTAEYPCGYLSGREARNLVADPTVTGRALYDQLIGLGFRRSGEHLYRPHCAGCRACLSLRVPADRLTLNRRLRRCRRRNADLDASWLPAAFYREHYALFQRYVAAPPPRRRYGRRRPRTLTGRFFLSRWSDSYLCELRRGGRLLAVAVADRAADGLSAVYTFFDPAEADRGLGNYAILRLLDQAALLGLPWLYLGYWVEHCAKMRYKADFRPHQVFRNDAWCWVS